MNPHTETLEMMARMKALMAAMEPALKQRAVEAAVDGGAAVAVRPWSFCVPDKGESDPWFGFARHDWQRMIKEGFRGICSPNAAGSVRAKVYIIFDDAAAWLRARSAGQAEALSQRGALTEGLREAKKNASGNVAA